MTIDERMNELYQVAGDDPVKIEQYLKIPLWDYWQILNNRIAIQEKQRKNASRKRNN